MIKVSTAFKIKTLIVINHLLVLSLFFIGNVNLNYLFITLLSVIIIGKIGGEIGFHRYFSHKSFETSHWKDKTLLILGSLNMVGSSISWCGTHRTHHVNTDKPGDPHSPYHQNWFNVWILNWKSFIIKPRYVSDFIKDPWHLFIHKYYFELCLLILMLGLYLNYTITIFLLCLPSVIQFHVGSLLIDIVCHKFGYRNFDTKDHSRNNFWVNIFTGGSGLHNNHHASPGDYYYVKRKGEWDIWGNFIKFFLLKT